MKSPEKFLHNPTNRQTDTDIGKNIIYLVEVTLHTTRTDS